MPQNQATLLEVHDDTTVNIRASDLAQNYLDLLAIEGGFQYSIEQTAYATAMPNPLRKLAQGDPLYTILIDKWTDDVSGNISKSYNKHWNTYISNRSLPRHMVQQEFHVRFVGTSQFASPAEQTAAVQEMVM